MINFYNYFTKIPTNQDDVYIWNNEIKLSYYCANKSEISNDCLHTLLCHAISDSATDDRITESFSLGDINSHQTIYDRYNELSQEEYDYMTEYWVNKLGQTIPSNSIMTLRLHLHRICISPVAYESDNFWVGGIMVAGKSVSISFSSNEELSNV